ncbi:hypothetical protein CDL15_Pgr012690 [Punica granatum]|uniref:Uncharacterized protein n=1 Tax=Punica granatum TaxID=22663 RepID=A0A218XEU3_PUNGR|nr:hypothetical protein CDL15_Pgr012690 [Punica granatum]
MVKTSVVKSTTKEGSEEIPDLALEQHKENDEERLVEKDSPPSSSASSNVKADSPREKAEDHGSNKSLQQFKLQGNFDDFSHAASKACVIIAFVDKLTVGTPSRPAAEDRDEKSGATVFPSEAKPPLATNYVGEAGPLASSSAVKPTSNSIAIQASPWPPIQLVPLPARLEHWLSSQMVRPDWKVKGF